MAILVYAPIFNFSVAVSNATTREIWLDNPLLLWLTFDIGSNFGFQFQRKSTLQDNFLSFEKNNN